MRFWISAVALSMLALSQASDVRAEVIWYPLPAEAYAFGQRYPEAQRLLYGFDYGHALIYEGLYLNRGSIADPAKFEQALLKQILGILKNPPTIKPDETDIAPHYTYGFPLILDVFDWSHGLHQFVYDVLTTSRDRGTPMQERIAKIFSEYQASPLALTQVCKTMIFMDGHYFSKAFRRTFPSLNLLIWSYHWFQIKLYEALMASTEAERDKGVASTVKEFWRLVSDLPDSADFDDMPETAKVAPSFSRMFPFIPGTFDNLHMLHDVVSDMLTSEKVKPEMLRAEGIRFARMGQNPELFRAERCPNF